MVGSLSERGGVPGVSGGGAESTASNWNRSLKGMVTTSSWAMCGNVAGDNVDNGGGVVGVGVVGVEVTMGQTQNTLGVLVGCFGYFQKCHFPKNPVSKNPCRVFWDRFFGFIMVFLDSSWVFWISYVFFGFIMGFLDLLWVFWIHDGFLDLLWVF